jgi:hypothetical protein
MRYPALLVLVATLFLAGAFLSGCSEDTQTAPGEPTEDFSNLDLEDPYGGYTATDEPELASDPYLADLASAGALAEDPLLDSPEVSDAVDGSPSYNLYVIRLTWGVLPQGDGGAVTEDGEDVDWSGTISSTNGTLVALRRILFEPREDHIVYPREDPTVLEFVSQTHGHFDGLLLLLAVPVEEDDGSGLLTFETGPFTQSWTYAELDSLNEIYDAEVAGHQVSIVSFRREPGACEAGFVVGHWHGDGLGRGVFRGIWMAYDGQAHGFLRGHYGARPGGPNVVYGKYFDGDGNFLGFIRGSYIITGRTFGRFRAVWLDADDQKAGGMRGHWAHIPRTRRGFFVGSWFTNCMEDEG